MAAHRKEKLEELIKRVIGDAMLTEIKDPRVGFASVHRVELDREYTVADVYISVLGSDGDKKRTLNGLRAACGFIRSRIGKQIKLRYIPEVRFHLDDSIEKAVDLVNLIDSVQGPAEGQDESDSE